MLDKYSSGRSPLVSNRKVIALAFGRLWSMQIKFLALASSYILEIENHPFGLITGLMINFLGRWFRLSTFQILIYGFVMFRGGILGAGILFKPFCLQTLFSVLQGFACGFVPMPMIAWRGLAMSQVFTQLPQVIDGFVICNSGDVLGTSSGYGGYQQQRNASFSSGLLVIMLCQQILCKIGGV